MKTLHFTITIHAPSEKVWRIMLDPESYRIWTAVFAPGSYYEGSWEKGERIRFLVPDGDGMSALIAENRPHEFISIKLLGQIKDGSEDTQSPEGTAEVPSFENYTFSEHNGMTELGVDVDVPADYEAFMQETWPPALQRLKEICE